MKLKQLIKNLPHIEVKGSKDVEITGIASHSSRVAPGNLFVAKRGRTFDGNTCIPEALLFGAVAVLSDIYDPSIKAATQLITNTVPFAESALAASFWQDPSSELHVVGITGTSGKTSTSYFVRQLFSHFGKQSGLIGTISYIIGERESLASHTTPDAITTQKLLREMVREQLPVCVMEVSSHALDQKRVAHVAFDSAIFTNLTHEHLDYHGTMEKYAVAKAELFASLGKKQDALAIFNAQDPYAKDIVGWTSARKISFALDEKADVVARNIRWFQKKSFFSLEWEGESVVVSLPGFGRFNVQNAVTAASLFLARGFSLSDVACGLQSIVPPPGRLERVENEKGLTIFVDYSHKEDALRRVLGAIREGSPERIIVVFGCGGDRDKEKRPKMAKAAEELADIVIVTTDNPRSEDPLSIIAEICSGFTCKEPIVLPDRREAIEQAIGLATSRDVVLIAGKGHEKTQIFAKETVVFDDCSVAKACCEEKESSVL